MATNSSTMYNAIESANITFRVSSSTDDCEPPDFEDPNDITYVRFALIGCLGSLVAVINICNNVVLFYLMLKRMSPQRSHLFYMTILCLVDIAVATCFLLIFATSVLNDIVHSIALYKMWLTYLRIAVTCGQMALTCSSYLIVAASIERYIATAKWANMTFDVKHRMMSVFVVFTIAILVKGSCYFEIKVTSNPHCPGLGALSVRQSELAMIYYYQTIWMFYTRTIVHVFIPFGLLLALNLSIIHNVSRESSIGRILIEATIGAIGHGRPANQRSGRSQLNQTSPVPSSCDTLDHCESNSPNNEAAATARKAKSSVRAATRMLIAIVCTYLVSNIISLTVSVWEFIDISSLRDVYDGVFYQISADTTTLFSITTGAIRLPIYYACNKQIRDELKSTLSEIGTCCKQRRQKEHERCQALIEYTYGDSHQQFQQQVMGNGSASNGHVRQSESDEMEIVDLTVAQKPSVVPEKPRIPTSHQREPLVSVEEVQQECALSSAYESLCSSTSTHSRPHIIYRKPSHLIALTSTV